MPLTAEHRGRICVGLLASNPLATEQLRGLLKGDAAFRVRDGGELSGRSLSVSPAPSVIVIDRGSLPQSLSGCLCAIRLRYRSARTLVLDQRQPLEELLSLLVLGVHGFVAYENAGDELAAAIRQVGEGHLWFESDVLEQYIAYTRSLERIKRGSPNHLTRRERHIVDLLQRRLANKEIATILGISENTVKFHLSNIYAKLNLHDRHSVLDFAKERLLAGAFASETG